MKHLTFQISIFLLLLITFTSCEKEYPTNVDTVWTRGLISDQSPFEFLNKNIIISWNTRKQNNHLYRFRETGNRRYRPEYHWHSTRRRIILLSSNRASLFCTSSMEKFFSNTEPLRIFLSHRISPKSRGNRYSFIGIYTFRLGMDRSILKFHRGDFI